MKEKEAAFIPASANIALMDTIMNKITETVSTVERDQTLWKSLRADMDRLERLARISLPKASSMMSARARNGSHMSRVQLDEFYSTDDVFYDAEEVDIMEIREIRSEGEAEDEDELEVEEDNLEDDDESDSEPDETAAGKAISRKPVVSPVVTLAIQGTAQAPVPVPATNIDITIIVPRLVQRRTKLPAPAPSSEISLYSILRQNLGKDLSKVSMPVAMNEPLSGLQRMCEELEYSELLDRASKTAKSAERMIYVAAFAISGYASTMYRASKKPFTPLLGETFEYYREDKGM